MVQRQLVAFVVDDEDIIASTLGLILSHEGFYARSFVDPLDALNAVAESTPPDLLLTDVVMPGINGIELAKQVRQRYPDCKVVLFSGQSTTVNLLEAEAQGGCYFEILAKPVHPQQLLAKIEDLFEPSPTAVF